MLKRGFIGEGWLGEMYSGEDAQGRLLRLISMGDFSQPQRDWVLNRYRLMSRTSVIGACPQLGVQILQGVPYWVGSWREGVQLSTVLQDKHLPNTVFLSIVNLIVQSLYSAEEKGLFHGKLDANGIWLGSDGEVWLDGYGEVNTTVSIAEAKDIFDVGVLVCRMFLGHCSLPKNNAQEHRVCLRELFQELQSLGLPNQLPKQIIRLLAWNSDKRPSLKKVVERWSIPRSKLIIRSWLHTQYGGVFQSSLPESRIARSNSISELPFPSNLFQSTKRPPQIDIDDLDVWDTDSDITMEVLLDDVPLPTEEADYTESFDLDSEDPLDFEDELTQTSEFFQEFEQDFFDQEATETIHIEPSSNATFVSVSENRLEDEMQYRSDKPRSSVLWFVALSIILTLSWTGGLFESIVDTDEMVEIPVVPEQSKEIVETIDVERGEVPLDDDGSVEPNEAETDSLVEQNAPLEIPNINQSNVVEGPLEKTTSPPKVDSTSPLQQKAITNPPPPQKELAKRTSTKSVSTKKETSKPSVVAEVPKPKNNVENISIETPEPKPDPPQEEVFEEEASWETPSNIDTPIYAPKVETPEPVKQEVVLKKEVLGTVQVVGDVERVRLFKDGQDFIGSRKVPVGDYDVYVTFAGFSEFKLQRLNINEGQTHKILCDALFATCRIQ